MAAPLRVLVLGAGWGAKLHLAGFASCPIVEVVALASRTREAAEDCAARFGIPSVYSDIEQAMRREKPDIVSVATPPATHKEFTLAALDLGSHVLCDKPVALAAADVDVMRRAADERELRHATGFVWRHDPAVLRMRGLLAAGAIGEVVEIHSRSALGLPVLPMSWLYDAAAGGGALMQHGQHVIDQARWIIGSELVELGGVLHHDVKDALVGPTFHDASEAFGWAARHAGAAGDQSLERTPTTADTGYGFDATFANGVRAWFWESWHSTSITRDQVEVFGAEGSVVLRDGELTLVRPQGSAERVPLDEAPGHKRRWDWLAAAFADVINGGTDPSLPTLEDGWKVQLVADALVASSASKRRQSC